MVMQLRDLGGQDDDRQQGTTSGADHVLCALRGKRLAFHSASDHTFLADISTLNVRRVHQNVLVVVVHGDGWNNRHARLPKELQTVVPIDDNLVLRINYDSRQYLDRQLFDIV